MKAGAEAGGEFEGAIVCHEHDDVARGVEDRGADFAGFEMAVYFGTQFRVHLAIDVSGDVLPDVFAVDPHAPHPNNLAFLGANPLSLGARSRCSRARARWRRTLTVPSVMPSAAAVSLTSISSMSLSSTTLR